eukprot:CAMPEP_0196593398 /NCGR_PEP_ID=MMETSP1081-20130531/75533_1 /TAXON_ID=36882 /ORGANISM="Pyramimonas amylifera, Strain CCMP720" /LENGTH=123 /DNA_ID=CAMNT_0041917371 /DNA_START=77 /DNA_END=448 /DNA_ORIENTATION=-
MENDPDDPVVKVPGLMTLVAKHLAMRREAPPIPVKISFGDESLQESPSIDADDNPARRISRRRFSRRAPPLPPKPPKRWTSFDPDSVGTARESLREEHLDETNIFGFGKNNHDILAGYDPKNK